MFYKTNKEGKRFFRALLTTLIAVQMCLMPCYPYPSMAQTSSGENSNAPVSPSMAGETVPGSFITERTIKEIAKDHTVVVPLKTVPGSFVTERTITEIAKDHAVVVPLKKVPESFIKERITKEIAKDHAFNVCRRAFRQ